jgi:hypothetical protein
MKNLIKFKEYNPIFYVWVPWGWVVEEKYKKQYPPIYYLSYQEIPEKEKKDGMRWVQMAISSNTFKEIINDLPF